jgi:hypothetical protein
MLYADFHRLDTVQMKVCILPALVVMSRVGSITGLPPPAPACSLARAFSTVWRKAHLGHLYAGRLTRKAA